jgi:hypothetical protein
MIMEAECKTLDEVLSSKVCSSCAHCCYIPTTGPSPPPFWRPAHLATLSGSFHRPQLASMWQGQLLPLLPPHSPQGATVNMGWTCEHAVSQVTVAEVLPLGSTAMLSSKGWESRPAGRGVLR